MKKNNKGFSLVELIVAFAIAAIAGLAVYGMMSVGGNIFRSSSREVGLQYEQQIVVNQIRDYILESSDSICYDEASKSLYVFSQGIKEVTTSGVTTAEDSYDITELTLIKDLDESGAPAETGQIKYRTVSVLDVADDYKSKLNDEDRVVLGENVKDIVYDLTEVEKGKVTFTITFLDQDKEIASTQTVSLRNKIKNLDELGEIYDTTRQEVNSFIEGIIILRDEVEMGATDTIGKYISNISVQYDAKVVTNKYSTRAYSVEWSITLPEGKDADAAIINASSGLVTINSSKWSDGDTFTIRATSVDDKSKFKDLTIKIEGDAVFPTEAKLKCDSDESAATDGSEGIKVTNVKTGNGYAEYTLIPSIKYTDKVENKDTNELVGDEALDRIAEWVIEGDELPGVKYDIVSGVDAHTGKLRLSAEANNKTYIIHFTVKQRDVNGEVVKSNTITIHPTNIPEYNSEEMLLISAPSSFRRGTSFNAMASWKSNPGYRVQYFWKIVPYQDNTSAAWSSSDWSKNFGATISVGNEQYTTSYVYATPYSGNINQFGYFGTYISNANDDSVDEKGNKKNTDDDELKDITTDGWYTAIDPGRLLKVDIKSYLDWNNDYKVKILLFAYDKENNSVIDQTGSHSWGTDKLIVPVEAVVTIPAVTYALSPANYVNNEYRYSVNKEEYKEFLTELILRPNDKWPGEKRAFFASTTGLYIEASHSALVNDNEGRNIQSHYTYYRDKDKVNVKDKVITLKYLQNKAVTEGTADEDYYWATRTQLGFRLDVKKTQNPQNDFYKNYPNSMEYYSTLYQVNDVTYNGTKQTVYNYVNSNTFRYQINYEKRND